MVNIDFKARTGYINNSIISFKAKPADKKPVPLAIICDVYDKKTSITASDLIPVSDWQNTKNHGFLTTSVAHATAPDIEIMAFDYLPECGSDPHKAVKIKGEQLNKVFKKAIEIKESDPQRPISISLSVIYKVGSNHQAKQDCHWQDLNAAKDHLRYLYFNNEEGSAELFNNIKKFLSYPDTKLFVAAGNDSDTLNYLVLADSDKALGIYGTDSGGTVLPFFAHNDLTPVGGQALYNVYEDKNGKKFFMLKDQKVDLFDGFEVWPEFDMDRVKAILGDNLKGRRFEDVKDHLMSVKQLIKASGSEFNRLSDIEKKYLLDKQHLYIPVGWGIDSLQHYHLSSRGLFFGVDQSGKTYWSPDGSKPIQGAHVLGFIKGTSFAAPNAMMKDLVKAITHQDQLSFTGSVKLHRNKNEKVPHYIAYSKQAAAV